MSLVLGRLLGKGGYGKCFEMKCGDEMYAAKIVDVSGGRRRKLLKEIAIQSRLGHENVVRLYKWMEVGSEIWMLLELCEKENLGNVLEREKVLNVGDACEIMRQLCQGVKYLHERRVIHRDIKPDNIMLCREKIKIGDFGLASHVVTDEIKLKICGTPNYIAPEILLKTGYSFPADIWSLGCVLYTLLVGHCPFKSDTLQQTYNRIKSADFIRSPRIPLDLLALLNKMLTLNSHKRPPVTSIRFRPSSHNLLHLTNQTKTPSLFRKDSGCHIKSEELPPRRFKLLKLISQLLQAIRDPPSSKSAVKSIKNFKFTWVKSWHDHRKGSIYRLSDGTIGMMIKEDTWVYHPQLRTIISTQVNICCPEMMSIFMSYLSKHKCKVTGETSLESMPNHVVFFKKLPSALLLGLSDGTLQITTDKFRLVCSLGDQGVVITEISRRNVSYLLKDVLSSSKALANKLKAFQPFLENLQTTL